MADIEYVDVLRALPVNERAEISGLAPDGTAARTTGIQARVDAALTLAAAQRDTDSFERPGENYYGWTNDVNSPPPAVSIVPNSVFSTGSVDPGGKVLFIAGQAYIGPLEIDRIEEGESYQYVFAVVRVAPNAPNVNDNIIDVGVVQFGPAGSYLGTAIIPGLLPLYAANGLTFYRFTVSKIAGRGTVDLNTATRYTRPIVGNKSGIGKIGVASITKKEQFSALAGLIDAAEIATAIKLTDKIGLSSDGTSKSSTFENFAKELLKVINPPRYTTFERIDVTTRAKILRGVDPDLRQIDFQGVSSATVGASATGSKATLDMTNPTTVAYDGSSGTITFEEGGCDKPMSFVSSIAGPVTIALTRLSKLYQKYDLYGDDLMSFWPDQAIDDRFRSAMRIYLTGLNSDGLIALSGNRRAKTLFFAGASDVNNRINLFDPENSQPYNYVAGPNGFVTVPYFSVSGQGDSYIDTLMSPDSNVYQTDGNFMISKVATNNLDPDGVDMAYSLSNFTSSNILNGQSGVRTGSGRDLINVPNGAMFGFHRHNATDYTQWVNGVGVNVQRPAPSAAPSSTLKLMGLPGTSVTALTKLPLRVAIAGGRFNDPATAMSRLFARTQALLDACDQIRANP